MTKCQWSESGNLMFYSNNSTMNTMVDSSEASNVCQLSEHGLK